MVNRRVETHFGKLAEEGVWANLYDRQDKVNAETWSFLVRARRVMELLQASGLYLRDVLDIGCGTAPVARSVVAMGATYTGIDFSAQMVDVATRSLKDLVAEEKARLQIGDVTRIEFPNASFDAVLAMGVLEYLTIDDIRRVLLETSRVLRPGGVAILTIPKRFHWGIIVLGLLYPLRWAIRRRTWKKLKLERREEFDRLYLTPGELDGYCREAGFRKLDDRHYNFQLFCRPATLVGPRLCYLLNRPFEGLSRLPGGRFFATGYISMHRRD